MEQQNRRNRKKLAIKVLIALMLVVILGATLFACADKKLDAPYDFRREDNVFKWGEVGGAAEYIVSVNDQTFSVKPPECYFDFDKHTFPSGEYKVKVKAVGNGKSSDFTSEIAFTYDNRVKYTLNVIANNGGSVSIVNAQNEYPANSLVQIVAYPQEGFHLDGWYSDDFFKIGSSSTFSFTINSNTIIRAQFSPNAENVVANKYEDTELLGCSGDFAVFIHCPYDEEYIKDHFVIYDDYFLEGEDNTVVSGYEEQAVKQIVIEKLNNNYYKVLPKKNYDASGAYVAKATGEVTIFKEMTRLGNSANAQNADGDFIPEIADEEGITEMGFSIYNKVHADIKFKENVYVYSYADNPNIADGGSNVDGWVISKIGSGYNDAETNSKGGFVTENIEIERNGRRHTLIQEDIVGFGGGLTLNEELKAEDFNDSLFGKVTNIQVLGEGKYPVYFVELKQIEDEHEVFETLDVYTENDIDLKEAVDPNDPVLLARIEDYFYQNDEFQNFLAGTYVSVGRYADKRDIDIEPMNASSFLDKVNVKPEIQINGSKITITINGSIEVEFGKGENNLGHSAGKLMVSFTMSEIVGFQIHFAWINGIWIFKRGFDIKVVAEEETKFGFDVKVTFDATTQQSRNAFLVNKSTKCIHRTGCWHIDQMLETNKQPTDESLVVLVAQGYWPCGTCLKYEKAEWKDNVETQEFKNTMTDVLEYRDWGEAIKEISGVLTGGKGGKEEKDFELCEVQFVYIVAFKLKLYLHMSFTLEASVHYEHSVYNRTTMGVRVAINEFKTYSEKEARTVSDELTMTGRMRAEVGLRLEMSVGDPFGILELGIYGELGVYADLSGIVHVSNSGENYAAAYFEMGIYYDVGLFYSALWGALKGDLSLIDGNVPLLQMGHDKVVYGYLYDIDEVIVPVTEVKKDFTLNELGLLEVKNMKLPDMVFGTETLNIDNGGYTVNLVIEEINGQANWFIIEGNKVKVRDGAPIGSKFESLLTVSIKSADRAWTKYQKGVAVTYLPTIQVKLIGELECTSHNFIHLSEVPATCLEGGYEECNMCTRCRQYFNMNNEMISEREVIKALGHNFVTVDPIVPTCVAEGLSAGTICDRCFTIGVKQETVSPLGHTEYEEESEKWSIVTEPSCTSQGLKGKRCTNCTELFDYQLILPNGHSVDPAHNVPTCEEDVVCESCHAVLAEATGHYYGAEPAQTVPATCEEDGYNRYSCLRCGTTKDEVIPAKGHSELTDNSETWILKKATCETEGELIYKCDDCKKELTLIIKALGHKYDTEKWTVDVEPTCTTEGQRSIHCLVCGKIDENSIDAIDRLDHLFEENNYTVDKEPTCTEPGVKSIHCSRENCDERTGEIPIAPKKHDYSDWTRTKEPDCVNDGEKNRVCNRENCGHVETEVIPALGHDLSNDSNICKRCNKPIQREHEADHTMIPVDPVTATCVKDGFTAGIWCFACDRFIQGHEPVTDRDNHDFGDTIQAKEPNCVEIGWNEYKICKACGFSTYKELSTNGKHDFATEARKEATCMKPGNEEYRYCTRNGCELRKESVAKEHIIPVDTNAHDYKTVEAKKATCLEDGWNEYRYCDRFGCGYNEYEANITLKGSNGHTSLKLVEAKDATCTEIGWNAYEYCDYKYTDNDGIEHVCGYNTYKEIAARGHQKETINAVACSVSKDGMKIIPGYSAYKHCVICDKYFANKLINGKLEEKEYETKEKVLEAVKHNDFKTENKIAVEGSCTSYRKLIWRCNGHDECKGIELLVYNVGEYCMVEAPSDMHQGPADDNNKICSHCSNLEEHIFYNLGLEYEWVNDGYALVGIGSARLFNDGITDGIISVPPTYMGKPVKYIGNGVNAVNGFDLVEKVVLPNSITVIKNNAFKGYTNLSAIEMSESIVQIGDYAFKGCTNLSTIVMQESIVQIGNYAFSGCETLAQITLPNSIRKIGNRAFENTLLTRIELPGNIQSIGAGVFFNSAIEGVFYSGTKSQWQGVQKNISWYADRDFTVYCYDCALNKTGDIIDTYISYQDCSGGVMAMGLTEKFKQGELLIPAKYNDKPVVAITDRAFLNNSNINSVIISENVNSIGTSAFDGCSGITSVTINGAVTVGDRVFAECSALKYLTLGSTFTVKSKDESGSLFALCKQITRINVNRIEDWLNSYFGWGNPFLASEQWTENRNEYGLYADGSLVTEVTVPKGIKTIHDAAFDHYKKLKKITIGNDVEAIGHYVFACCTSLEEVVVGDNVQRIWAHAFYGCSNIKSMKLPFVGHAREIPDNSPGSALFGYIFGGDNPGDPEKYTHVTQYYADGNSEQNWIPDSLATITITGNDIRYGAFYGMNKVKRIILTGNVSNIGPAAFKDCYALTSVVLPDSLKVLERAAFFNCWALKEIVFPGNIVKIDSDAFNNCWALQTVTIQNSAISEINPRAFATCSALTTINFSGTVAQWQSINKADDWDTGNTGNYTIVCINGYISKDGKVTCK